jgi:hypothetical protein
MSLEIYSNLSSGMNPQVIPTFSSQIIKNKQSKKFDKLAEKLENFKSLKISTRQNILQQKASEFKAHIIDKQPTLITNCNECVIVLQQTLEKISKLLNGVITAERDFTQIFKKTRRKIQILENRIEQLKSSEKITKHEAEWLNGAAQDLRDLLNSCDMLAKFDEEHLSLDVKREESLGLATSTLHTHLNCCSPTAIHGFKEGIRIMGQQVIQASHQLTRQGIFESEVWDKLFDCIYSTWWSVEDCCHAFNSNFLPIIKNVEIACDEAAKALVYEGDSPSIEATCRLQENSLLLFSLQETVDGYNKSLKELKLLVKKSLRSLPPASESIDSKDYRQMEKRLNQLLETFLSLETQLPFMQKAVNKSIKQRYQSGVLERAFLSFKEDAVSLYVKNQINNFISKEHDSIEDTIDHYVRFKRKLFSLFLISPESREFCRKEEERLIKAAGHKEDFDGLVYALILSEREARPGLFARALQYIHPNNWSDKTKMYVHTALTGMQLSAQILESYQKITFNTLQLPEKTLTIAQKEQIDKEASILSLLISRDKYSSLKIEAAFDKLTKKVPEIKETLKVIMAHYPPDSFNSVPYSAIRQLRDGYVYYRHKQLLGKEIELPAQWISNLEVLPNKSVKQIEVLSLSNRPSIKPEVRDIKNDASSRMTDFSVGTQPKKTHLDTKTVILPSFIPDEISGELAPLSSDAALGKFNLLNSIAQSLEMIRIRTTNLFWGPSDEQIVDKKSALRGKLDGNSSQLNFIKSDLEKLGNIGKWGHETELISRTLIAAKNLIVSESASTARWQVEKDLNEAESQIELAQSRLTHLNNQIHRILEKKRSLLQLQTLVEAGSIPVDDSLFQHILGSFFGKGTGLEGYLDANMLTYIFKLTSNKISALKQNPLCEPASQLSFCRTLFDYQGQDLPIQLFSEMEEQMNKALKLGKAIQRDSTTFFSAFYDELRKLSAGKSFFFQGGWMQESGGSHSILYEIIQQKDGLFTFRAYNRGDGLQYYTKAVVQGKNQYLPFTEIIDISSNRFSMPFLKALHELTRSPVSGEKWEAKDLYECILPALGGKISQHLYSSDQVLEMLQVGHCSYLSLTAWMSQHLGDQSTYSRWQLEMELKTLLDYYEQQGNRFPHDEQALRLMREGLLQFGRNSVKAYAQGLITDEEMVWIQEKMKAVSQTLKKAESTYHVSILAKAPLVDIQPVVVNITFGLKQTLFEHMSLGQLALPSQYKSLDYSSWEYDSQNFNNDLINFQNQINVLRAWDDNSLDLQTILSIKEEITTFLSKVPLTGDVFWKQMNAKEGKEVIELLASLNRLHLWSVLKLSKKDHLRSNRLYIEDFLIQTKIFTLADAVVRYFKTQFGFELPNLSQKEMQEILEGYQLFAEEQTPRNSDERRKLRAYWREIQPLENRESSEKSFFGISSEKKDAFEYYAKENLAFDRTYNENNEVPDWPDFVFAKKWLSQPKSMKKFNKEYPEYQNESLNFKAFVALGDSLIIDKKEVIGGYFSGLLPAQFYALRDIAYTSNFLLMGPWDKDYNYVNEFPDKKVIFHVQREKTKDKNDELVINWDLEYQFVKLEMVMVNYYGSYGGPSSSFQLKLHAAQGDLGPMSSLLGGIDPKEKQFPLRKRISPHDRLIVKLSSPQSDKDFYSPIFSKEIFSSFNFADTQELLALSSVQELQVSETIAYFSKYSSHLQHESYRLVFKFLLSEKGLFIEELIRSPNNALAISEKLASLFKEEYRRYFILGDIKNQLAILELNNFFHSQAEYVREHYPNSFSKDYSDPFMKMESELKNIINIPSTQQENRSFAAYLLAKLISNKKVLNANDITEMLYAAVQLRNFPLSEKDLKWSPVKINEQRDFLHKIRHQLKKILQGEEKNQILNALIRLFKSDSIDQEWNIYGDFPIFVAGDKVSYINALSGEFYLKGEGTKPLPSEIRKHFYFNSLFAPEEEVLATQLEMDLYAFKDKNGNECLVKKNYLGITLHRKIGEVWYQAHDPYHLLWDFPFAFIQDGACLWASETGNHIFVAGANDDTFKYRLMVNVSNQRNIISSIHQLDNEQKDTGEVLLDISTEPYKFLERIEDARYIGVWVKEDSHEPTRIELPRFGLEFTVKFEGKERRAYCNQLPGYYLAPKQYVQQMGDITTYLVLENEGKKDKIKQLVLMPRQQMQGLTNPLKTETVPLRYDFQYQLHDVDPVSQKLKPRTEEARLHLAMMYLWKRDYTLAIEYLRGYQTQLNQFSNKELELISWIVNLARANKDETPQAIAIKMYANFLTIRNQIDFVNKNPLDVDNLKRISTLFDQYTQVKDQMGLFRLHPDEELFLTKSLSIFYKQILAGYYRNPFNLLTEIFYPLTETFSKEDAKKVDVYREIEKLENRNKIRFNSLNPKEFQKIFFEESVVDNSALSVRSWDFTKQSEIDGCTCAVYSLLQYDFDLEIGFGTKETSLLRSPFNKELLQILASKIKESKYDDMISILFTHIVGVPPSIDMPKEQLRADVIQLLWMIRSLSNSNLVKAFANLLGKQIQDPSQDYLRIYLFGTEEEKNNQFWTNQARSGFLSGWNPEIPTIRSDGLSDIAMIISKPVIKQEEQFALEASSRESKISPSFQTSIEQKNLLFFSEPIVEDITPYVTLLPALPERAAFLQGISQALQKLFTLNTGNHVADRKFEQLKREIKDFSSNKRMKDRYEIKDLQALHTLKEKLKDESAGLSMLLNNKVAGIEELANKPFEDSVLEAEKQARITGRLEKPLRMAELLQLFRIRDREKYHHRAGALSLDEIDVLDRELSDFLISSTYRQHQQRLIDKIDDIEKAVAGKVSQLELEGLLRDFVSIAKATRNYDVSKHREYLNLENSEKILIRADQEKNQIKIANYQKREGTNQKNGAAIEIIPGAGKTSIHTTIQVLNDADGIHLPILVMPESLMPQMSQELRDRLGDAFETYVEMMTFDRDQLLNSLALTRILDRFESIIKGNKVLLITDSSVQSLFLKFIEKVLSNPIEEEILLFREIFKVLRESGAVTIDEMHLILDVLKAHHFTLGEPQPVKEEVVIAVTDFYLILDKHPQIKEKIKFAFFGKEGALFNENYYQREVQPIIVQAITNGELGGKDKQLQEFFKSLTREGKELVASYLNNEKNVAASDFVEKIPSMKIKNFLAVLKEETSRLLPLTAKKELGIDYGVLPKKLPEGVKRKDNRLAIPYHGSNNPMIKSQFGTDLEIINYTIQMFLEMGIGVDIVYEEIEHLKEHISEGLKLGRINHIEESPSYIAFMRLCGGNKYFSPFNLNKEDIQAITREVNKNRDVQMELISRYVLPQLKRYSMQLHTNGQIYAALFNMVRGFSGTLFNEESFPRIFYEIFLSDTMAKTLFILMENCPKKVETFELPKELNLKNLVATFFKEERAGSIADYAGIFKITNDNESIAREMLYHLPSSIKGVAYFTKADKLFVLLRDQSSGVPIDQSGLEKEQIATFFDQQHTFGANSIMGTQMTTSVTVGPNSMLYGLIQAVWRMRQLDEGQTVNFMVNEETDKIIRDTLERITGKKTEHHLTLEDLLVFTTYNQAIKQGDDNYRSLKQKMEMLLITKVVELMVDPNINRNDLIDIIIKTKELFVASSSLDPYEQYGRSEDYMSKKEVIPQDLQQFLDSPAMKTFATHPILKARYPIQEIKAALYKMAEQELDKLPHMLLSSANYNTEVAVESRVETEIEAKTKVESKIQVQRRIELYNEDGEISESFPIFKWDKNQIFAKNTYLPTKSKDLSEAYFGYAQINSFLNLGLTPIVTVDDVINNEKMTDEYGNIFDPNLLATVNMMPVYQQNQGLLDRFRPARPLFRPFGKYDDVASSNVLIIENKQAKSLQMVLADQEDVRQFKNLLQEDQSNTSFQQREMRVCLYNLASEIYEQGADQFASDFLSNNAQLVKLKAQAKFYRGFLTYDEAEKEALHKWIQSKGPDRMKIFFHDIVLNNKPTQQQAFLGSNIDNIFKNLGVKI